MKDIASKILSRQQNQADKAARAALRNAGKPKVTAGRVLKYMFLPDLGSRIHDIGQRLGGFAFFLAQIFYACRLIPAGHPTLNSANIGYFGFSDVIATAAGNLRLRKENTDQVLMFSGVVLSMVLLLANGLAVTAYTVFDFKDAMASNAAGGGVGPAASSATTSAASTLSGNIFVTPHPESDIALRLLDRVFGTESVPFFAGTPGAYNSGLGSNAIKDAIYSMLGIYSTAMMVIAMIIVIYYAFTVVGESAMTGQPFGKRFNSFWAPIRLVVGLGLLVPLGSGLNTAQYITLYMAKMGSGLASYAWSNFTVTLKDGSSLIAEPEAPMVSGLISSIVRFQACKHIQNIMGGEKVEIRRDYDDDKFGEYLMIKWQQANNTGILGFGEGDKDQRSMCGMIKLTKIDPDHVRVLGMDIPTMGIKREKNGSGSISSGKNSLLPDYNNLILHNGYKELVNQLIDASDAPIKSYVQTMNRDLSAGEKLIAVADEYRKLIGMQAKLYEIAGISKNTVINDEDRCSKDNRVGSNKIICDFKDEFNEKYKDNVDNSIGQLDKFGWMGAGMFYNQIADLNGTLVNLINRSFPEVIADIDPSMVEAASSPGYNEALSRQQRTLQVIEEIFQSKENPEVRVSDEGNKLGPIYFVINHLFGGGLMSAMRSADQTNPMANMVAMGKGFLDKAWMVVLGAGTSVAGNLIAIIPDPTGFAKGAGEALKALGGVLLGIGMIGIIFGVVLYYMLPVIPFIFFFFSVLAWVLSVIESLVGLPLWALAHIRIDGDGLSGQAASNGYFMIFDILLRPILILFALIVSIILFSAGMMTLREMFSFYVNSIGDGENTGVDYIAFSGVYTIIAYTLAMLCFKQSDQMPKQVMRWINNVSSYNDGQPDPAQGIERASIGAGVAANSLRSEMQNAVGGIGQVADEVSKTRKKAKDDADAKKLRGK